MISWPTSYFFNTAWILMMLVNHPMKFKIWVFGCSYGPGFRYAGWGAWNFGKMQIAHSPPAPPHFNQSWPRETSAMSQANVDSEGGSGGEWGRHPHGQMSSSVISGVIMASLFFQHRACLIESGPIWAAEDPDFELNWMIYEHYQESFLNNFRAACIWRHVDMRRIPSEVEIGKKRRVHTQEFKG